MSKDHPRSSRQRYRRFVRDYQSRKLDEALEQKPDVQQPEVAASPTGNGSKQRPRAKQRRQYLREYARWLWPHRGTVGVVFVLALLVGGLEMVQPLFMRFIVDRVLLKTGLDSAARLVLLQYAGAVFLGVIIFSNLINAFKDYRQRLLNARVMLELRRSLFERLLHLPLPKLWDMKTGGILSRLTGDVDTTTGLLQMAIISPAVSLLRLMIAVGILVDLNWRLALTALAIIPGVMLVSFTVARRVRPIYRSLRKMPSRSTAVWARPSREFVSSALSVASNENYSITFAAGIPCCARSCLRTGANWCFGLPGACYWGSSTSSSSGMAVISTSSTALRSAISWLSSGTPFSS